MDHPEIAEMRADVAAARDCAAFDLGRYLRLQELVDALDRTGAAMRLIASGSLPSASVEIAETAAELAAALAAAASILEPTLQQRVASVAAMFDNATMHATRSARASSTPHASVRAKRRNSIADTGEAEAPSPVPALTPIRLGASAPRAALPGSRFVAYFVAYPEGAVDEARTLLSDALPEARLITEVGGDAVAVGTVVEVAVSGAGMTIEGGPRDVQRFLWTGRLTLLSFELQLASDVTSTVLRFDVMVDGIVLARMRLPVEVTANPQPSPHQNVEACLATKAFASYSSKDRERVIDRVAAIRIAAKVDVFLDCHDLNPGEAWEPSLARAIDNCDTFLLFWSEAAATSRWVQWEWKRALTKPGLQGMQFHPLENNVKPPRQLAKVHLGDPYMDLRAAERVRRATALATGETR